MTESFSLSGQLETHALCAGSMAVMAGGFDAELTVLRRRNDLLSLGRLAELRRTNVTNAVMSHDSVAGPRVPVRQKIEVDLGYMAWFDRECLCEKRCINGYTIYGVTWGRG